MLPTFVVTVLLMASLPSGTTERSPLRLQVLLDRAHFSPGEISGSNQRRALAAFARARVVSGRGQDETVWQALSADTAPTLVAYTTTEQDLAGPFVKIPVDGIHGTPEPSRIGKTSSHGCIRLTNWDAAELSHLVSAGTPAVLQE